MRNTTQSRKVINKFVHLGLDCIFFFPCLLAQHVLVEAPGEPSFQILPIVNRLPNDSSNEVEELKVVSVNVGPRTTKKTSKQNIEKKTAQSIDQLDLYQFLSTIEAVCAV